MLRRDVFTILDGGKQKNILLNVVGNVIGLLRLLRRI